MVSVNVLDIEFLFGFWKNEKVQYVVVCLLCFGLNSDVLSVSMSFSVIFCIYEHIEVFSFVFVFRKVEIPKHDFVIFSVN